MAINYTHIYVPVTKERVNDPFGQHSLTLCTFSFSMIKKDSIECELLAQLEYMLYMLLLQHLSN